MPDRLSPIALVLAAGPSRRFGRDKRFVQLGGGHTIIERVLAHIAKAGLVAKVVLASDDPKRLDYAWPVPQITIETAQRGVGASLGEAARTLADDQPILVCLADMPFIQSATYAAVAAGLEPGKIVVPSQAEKYGHPIAFAADFLPALRRLDGDEDALKLLEQFPGQVIELVVDDAGIHRDINTVADLLRWGAGKVQ